MSFRYAELSSSETYLRFGSNCRLRGLEFPVIPPHIATRKDKPWFLIHLSVYALFELRSRVLYWGNSNILNYHVVE
ncbi:hypothetical protein Hanom_Chr08g00738201 [Helianthus anomalus]